MLYPLEYNPTTSTVIIEPVGGECNLSCAYCYHDNIREQKLTVMSDDILEKLVADALQLNNERVKFLWHGGEPMLAGIQFYQTVVKLQRRYRTSEKQVISNHIQTNATLINNEWAQFFKEHRFRVSSSIDGPDWLHNKCRTYKSGNGAFEKTMQGIDALRQLDMSIGVVVTVNQYNVKFPDLLYQTLMELNINSFELNIATDVINCSSMSPDSDEAVAFLTRVFDLWFDTDDPSVYIRIFSNTIKSLIGLPVRDCSFSYNRCQEYLACDEKGDFYTCGRFLKESVAYVGSVDDSMIQLISSKKIRKLYDQVAKIKDECMKCRWLGACGGGCAYQRWLNGGFGSLFPQCEMRKALFEHIEKRVTSYL